MDAALQSLPIETLQQRLAEALSAQHDLSTGRRVVQVTSLTGQRVQYSESTMADLRGYIASLQNAISAKQSPSGGGRRPIYLSY